MAQSVGIAGFMHERPEAGARGHDSAVPRDPFGAILQDGALLSGGGGVASGLGGRARALSLPSASPGTSGRLGRLADMSASARPPLEIPTSAHGDVDGLRTPPALGTDSPRPTATKVPVDFGVLPAEAAVQSDFGVLPPFPEAPLHAGLGLPLPPGLSRQQRSGTLERVLSSSLLGYLEEEGPGTGGEGELSRRGGGGGGASGTSGDDSEAAFFAAVAAHNASLGVAGGDGEGPGGGFAIGYDELDEPSGGGCGSGGVAAAVKASLRPGGESPPLSALSPSGASPVDEPVLLALSGHRASSPQAIGRAVPGTEALGSLPSPPRRGQLGSLSAGCDQVFPPGFVEQMVVPFGSPGRSPGRRSPGKQGAFLARRGSGSQSPGSGALKALSSSPRGTFGSYGSVGSGGLGGGHGSGGGRESLGSGGGSVTGLSILAAARSVGSSGGGGPGSLGRSLGLLAAGTTTPPTPPHYARAPAAASYDGDRDAHLAPPPVAAHHAPLRVRSLSAAAVGGHSLVAGLASLSAAVEDASIKAKARAADTASADGVQPPLAGLAKLHAAAAAAAQGGGEVASANRGPGKMSDSAEWDERHSHGDDEPFHMED